MGRHRRTPPFPVRERVSDQGIGFWIRFAGGVALAVAFVIFYGWWAWQHTLAEHGDVVLSIDREWPS